MQRVHPTRASPLDSTLSRGAVCDAELSRISTLVSHDAVGRRIGTRINEFKRKVDQQSIQVVIGRVILDVANLIVGLILAVIARQDWSEAPYVTHLMSADTP
jgi:hypothetical protein